MSKRDLIYHSADNGHCQVYYRAKREGRGYDLLCFQLQTRTPPTFALLFCSQDGEPSHNADVSKFASVEAPKGDERIEDELRQWLRQEELS